MQKLLQIAFALLNVAVKNQSSLSKEPLRAQVLEFVTNCIRSKDDLLILTVSQLFVYLHLPTIIASPQALTTIVKSLQSKEQDQAQKKHITAAFSYLVRLLDYTTIFAQNKTAVKLISLEMASLLKDSDSEVRRFS